MQQLHTTSIIKFYNETVGKSLLDPSEQVRFEKHGAVILIVDSNVENLTKLHHYMRSHGYAYGLQQISMRQSKLW